MRRITLLVVVALLLASCSSQATTTPEPTEAPALPTVAAPTMAAPTVMAPASTEPVATEAAPSAGGVVVYKIVPGESTVSYEVGETFFSENNRFAVAVGVTSDVNGEVQVDHTNPQNSMLGPVTVDISKLQSDSGRRDGRIREQWLESARYPIATFTPTGTEGLPSAYTEGQPINFKVAGDLTVREATQPVTFDVTATLQGGALTGTATTTILMSAFGVGPIEIAGILGTEDEVKLTISFVARP